MATTSGRYATGASGIGTSSNPSQEGYWTSYAVPSQNENAAVNEQKSQFSNDDIYAKDQRQNLSSHNSVSSQPSKQRNSTKSKSEYGYSTSPGGMRPSQTEYQNGNGAYNEIDPALDVHKGNGGDRSRGASRDRQRVKRKGSKGAVTAMDDTIEEDRESKWIHRDKLMQIESRELAEMGARRSKPSRAGSRTKSVRTVKSSVDVNEATEEEMPSPEDMPIETKRLRQKSPSPKEEDMANGSDPQLEFARNVSQREQEPHRPGTSRIPVSTNSNSFGSEGESVSGQHHRSGSMSSQKAIKQRGRSQSGGSQHMLDMASSPQTPDLQEPRSPSSTQNSPPKKGGPASGNRRPSATRKVSNPRNRSGSAVNGESPKRPGTSGSRPPTARPEGDPPWIATMYKPDPMIPPDQQMLPTHAKRLAQLQQEAEQRASQEAMQDSQQSEYTLLDSEDVEPQNSSTSRIHNAEKDAVVSQEKQQEPDYRSYRSSTQGHDREMSDKIETGQWPLRSPSPDEAQQQAYEQSKLEQSAWSTSGRPSPNGTNSGPGYGLMPGVQKSHGHRMSQRSGTSNLSTQREGGGGALVDQPVRLREPSDDVVVKSKGCGCCAVM